jgi:hypothetical protein
MLISPGLACTRWLSLLLTREGSGTSPGTAPTGSTFGTPTWSPDGDSASECELAQHRGQPATSPDCI